MLHLWQQAVHRFLSLPPEAGLVIQGKAISFPKQQFDLVAPSVQKDEHRSFEGIQLHQGRHNATEAVKTFAHIGSAGV